MLVCCYGVTVVLHWSPRKIQNKVPLLKQLISNLSFIFSFNSPLSCNLTYSQVPRTRMRTYLGGCILPPTLTYYVQFCSCCCSLAQIWTHCSEHTLKYGNLNSKQRRKAQHKGDSIYPSQYKEISNGCPPTVVSSVRFP